MPLSRVITTVTLRLPDMLFTSLVTSFSRLSLYSSAEKSSAPFVTSGFGSIKDERKIKAMPITPIIIKTPLKKVS
jgi:hypothetical protein